MKIIDARNTLQKTIDNGGTTLDATLASGTIQAPIAAENRTKTKPSVLLDIFSSLVVSQAYDAKSKTRLSYQRAHFVKT